MDPDNILRLKEILGGEEHSKIPISLDIESTIANVEEIALNLYNASSGRNLRVSDFKDWGFKTVNIENDVMIGFYSRAWMERSAEIELTADRALMESFLGTFSSTHVVTNKEGVDEFLRAWLEKKGLGSVPLVLNGMKSEKTALNYKVYIDDSPGLAKSVMQLQGCVQLLVDRPWNQDIEEHGSVIRVKDVNEAFTLLLAAAGR